MDYNAGLPVESASLYYHTNDEEKRRIFPADPNIGRTKVTDSVAPARRARFREDVAGRDGVRLVGGDAEALRRRAPSSPSQGRLGMLLLVSICPQACSPSQRRQCILTYTKRRSRDPTRRH